MNINHLSMLTEKLIMGLPERIRFRSFLRNSPMHVAIIGPRGVGKTTMLVSSIIDILRIICLLKRLRL